MSPREIIDDMLKTSGRGDLAGLEQARWIDCQPGFDEAHYLNGFGHKDRKFHFKVDWPAVPYDNEGPVGRWRELPMLPDHWAATEEVDSGHPFRLATSPARSFLNSSFNETPTSRKREGRPCALMHPADAAELGVGDGDIVTLGNARGELRLHVKLSAGGSRGVIVSEGLWDNADFLDGKGINTLTGDDPVAPFGGAAFHDARVWAKAEARVETREAVAAE
jgi:anaerobic selenocysteine-containing dehydrogenase